jgi:uncharacterized protein YndB with AHSA1/START domain
MQAHERTRDPADGVLDAAPDGQQILRFERRLPHPVEKVWAALTDPGEIEAWLAATEIDDLVVGGRIVLRWLNSDEDGNQAVMDAEITELDPPRLFEFSGDPHGTLRWELRPDGDGCLLSFTARGAFGDEAASARAGWHIHFEHLADALDGRPIDWPRWHTDHFARWKEIEAEYAQE